MNTAIALNLLYEQSFFGTILFLVIMLCYLCLERWTPLSMFPFLWFSFLSAMVVPWAFIKKLFPHDSLPDPVWLEVSALRSINQGVQQSLFQGGWSLQNGLLFVWLLGVVVSVLLYVIIPVMRHKHSLSTMRIVTQETHHKAKKTLSRYQSVSRLVVFIPDEKWSKTPFVSGFIFPKLFIPDTFFDENNADAIKGILLHEEAHMKSFDNLKLLIARIITALFWFLPFTYFVLFMLRRSQELAADNFALLRLGARERLCYAQAMASMAILQGSDKGSFVSAFNHINHITRRLIMIKKFKRRGFVSQLLPLVVLFGGMATAYASSAIQDDLHLKISGQILENGKLISSPTIIVNSGSTAKIITGDGKKIMIMEILATYFEPNSVALDVIHCEKAQAPGASVPVSEETCGGMGQSMQFSGPLDFIFQASKNNFDFNFEVSKLKIIKN